MKTFSELREQKNKKLDEISLSHLKKKIANSGGMKQVMKANKADKLKKELEAMNKKLAAEAYGDEPASEDEFRMAKKQAEFIGYVAEEIEDHLENGGNFPEWMQNMLSELHQKAMDMHSTLGSYDAEEDDDDMNEKTLTPAEKKKREEIAKAMERDNPGMPMAKKMAIATAQAKKVAEDVELDEGYGADIAKEVRNILKNVYGLTNRDVSVKVGSGGGSINIQMKTMRALALEPKLKDIAKSKESISRDYVSGEILQGGNFFVFTRMSDSLENSLDRALEAEFEKQGGEAKLVDGKPVTLFNTVQVYMDSRSKKIYASSKGSSVPYEVRDVSRMTFPVINLLDKMGKPELITKVKI